MNITMMGNAIMTDPGFCRRVLIEPGPGLVTARLEDDWHRMTVSLHHREGVVTRVASAMERSPWTTCPGAMERLDATFTGTRLADVARRGEKPLNCTHLYDLAILAAAHAEDASVTDYGVAVSDPRDGRQDAVLRRNGTLIFEWSIAGDRLVAPAVVEGRRLTGLGDWIAGLGRGDQEAARLLRWAMILSTGRQMDIPDHSSGRQFANGSCFTFQPDRAGQATRMPAAHQDFSMTGRVPLADRQAPAHG